jgi:hypothetical protein
MTMSPTGIDPVVIVGLVVPVPLVPVPLVTKVGVPTLPDASCSVQVLAVVAVSNVTVITVDVCSVPPFCSVVKIAPSWPALAAPGSTRAETRRVHVLPSESVTVKVVAAVPPE